MAWQNKFALKNPWMYAILCALVFLFIYMSICSSWWFRGIFMVLICAYLLALLDIASIKPYLFSATYSRLYYNETEYIQYFRQFKPFSLLYLLRWFDALFYILIIIVSGYIFYGNKCLELFIVSKTSYLPIIVIIISLRSYITHCYLKILAEIANTNIESNPYRILCKLEMIIPLLPIDLILICLLFGFEFMELNDVQNDT
eukprot:146083_1